MDEFFDRQRVTVELCKRYNDENLGLVTKAIDLNTEDNLIDKPVILCCGGNKTKDIFVANSNAKVLERFVGKFNEPYDILSISYGDEYMLNKEKNARLLCNKLLLPLVSDNGQRLSFGEAMKRMRRVNVFAHCAGAPRFNDIISVLKQDMEQLGYTNTEKDNIMGQIFVVGYAPWSFINDKNIKKIYLQSIEDNMAPRVVERLYTAQTKNMPDPSIKFSHQDLEIAEHESYKVYLLRLYKTLMTEKIVSYSSQDRNNLCYISKGQSNDLENYDHELKYVIRNNKFALCDKSSDVANTMSLLISEPLLLTLSQSIVNETSKKAETLYSLSHIQDVCDSIVNKTKVKSAPDEDLLSFLK